MSINLQLIVEYIDLLKQNRLQPAYQELLKFINHLRKNLVLQLPTYKFTQLSENKMDYSYFQFTDTRLSKRGLKFVVVFMHSDGTFQLWLSGNNRQVQTECYPLVNSLIDRYEITPDPKKLDYILRRVICVASGEVDLKVFQFEIENAMVKFIRDIEQWLDNDC